MSGGPNPALPSISGQKPNKPRKREVYNLSRQVVPLQKLWPEFMAILTIDVGAGGSQVRCRTDL